MMLKTKSSTELIHKKKNKNKKKTTIYKDYLQDTDGCYSTHNISGITQL